MAVTDLDGDGDLDVLSASYGDHKVAWYENTDGLGDFGAQGLITTEAIDASSVAPADLDGDGNPDVVAAFGSTIAWYENTDARATFGTRRVITAE